MGRLQDAIAQAKAGYELSARDLFLTIVRDEPDNKIAWLWLVGLLDDTDDLIIACENILRIDPADEVVRMRLDELLQFQREEETVWIADRLAAAETLIAAGDVDASLMHLREILKRDSKSEHAWGLLAIHSRDFGEQVKARKALAALDPDNAENKAALDHLLYFDENPYDLAQFHEERGDLIKAIKVYEKIAKKATHRREWDRVVGEIERIEALQREKIVFVSPLISLLRLAAGPPLLFLFLLITHLGYDFSYLTLFQGLEFLTVVLGAFLLALASVGGQHMIWRRLGNVAGRATKPLRILVRVTGVVVTFTPFFLLGVEAYYRWTTVFAYLGY